MKIYEIDQAIIDLIDPETGEIKDFSAMEKLNMARDKKIENIAVWIKNLNAESKAIREEEKALAERRGSTDNKKRSLEKYLKQTLNGEKFKTAKVAITYRKSVAVDIEDEESFIKTSDATYLVPQPSKIDKKTIKEALNSGAVIEGAELVERNNMQIK